MSRETADRARRLVQLTNARKRASVGEIRDDGPALTIILEEMHRGKTYEEARLVARSASL